MDQLSPQQQADVRTKQNDFLVTYYNSVRKLKVEWQAKIDEAPLRKINMHRIHDRAQIELLDTAVAAWHAESLKIDENEAEVRKQWKQIKKKSLEVREGFILDVVAKLMDERLEALGYLNSEAQRLGVAGNFQHSELLT